MDILKELLEKFNYEEIAVKCGVSSRTVRRWERKEKLSLAIKLMLEKIQRGEL